MEGGPGRKEQAVTVQPTRWLDFTAILLAFIGTVVAPGGALIVFASLPQTPGQPVWPLPGLALLDWAALGIFGFLGAYFGMKIAPGYWVNAAWFAAGGLIPLVILGAFSIGTLVFLSLLFQFVSAILISVQKKAKWIEQLGFLMLGAVCNLGVLFLFISMSRTG